MKPSLRILRALPAFAVWFALVPTLLANTLSPSSATVKENTTKQFTASTSSYWKTSCGTISTTGLFKAALKPQVCTITATAKNGSGSATAKANVVSPNTITPIGPRTPQGQHQQFTSSVPANWNVQCGSISSSGLYLASAAANTYCTVRAVAISGVPYETDSYDHIMASNYVLLSPLKPTVQAGATIQFHQGITSGTPKWTATCGTITSAGLYTAPAGSASCTVTVSASSGQKVSTVVTITGGSSTLAVSPLNPTVGPNGTVSFTATISSTWAASCGTIGAGPSATAAYTAPGAPGSCTVTAKANNGSGQTASTTVTVKSVSLAITPSNPTIYALGPVNFSANTAVNWTASCGSIDGSSGAFTAPSTAGSCTVTATDTSNASNTAQTIVTTAIVNYTTWLGDNKRTGANTREYVLTPGNAGSLHQAWSASLDGTVWHQPLYMNAISIAGAPHNVVFVGTSNDSMYALDGDTGAQLWQKSFLSAGVTAVAGSSIGGSMGQMGIIGTPVIDPTTNTLYVVAFTAENNNTTFVHRLHALDITTGQDKTTPAVIQDSQFTDARHNNRCGLLLANGQVYVAFGGIGDKAPYHGYVFAYNASSLAQTAVFNATPGGLGAGIWMSTAAPSTDDNGNLYVSTGNGDFDGTTKFGSSVLKLSPGLQELDYFTPYDQASLSSADLDLGSAGVLVLPDQPGSHPHQLITCGKPKPIYILDRDNMGKYGSSSDNILERITGAVGGTASYRLGGEPCFTSPALWNNSVYFAANGDVLKRFTLSSSTGLMSTSPASQGSTTFDWPGGQPVITSNGNSNGIVWTMDPYTGILRANDANNLGSTLYTSSSLGSWSKWMTATPVNGHVYIGFGSKVVGFTVP